MSGTIVTLRNRDGHALHCMLEQPPTGIARAAIAAIFLCPGVKTRVGPHRLYRKLSAPFLARGIPVLRVDFRGLGDSEGDWPDESIAGIYRLTALGHCVDDARSALDWFESQLGIRRCIVGGLCGAASTALHLARVDSRLAALYAIGLPARLDDPGDERLSAAELRSHWSRYLRKVLSPSSWLRLVSFQSDYRLLWRSFSGRVRHVPNSGQAAQDLTPHLTPGFLHLLRTGRPALLMFGERDPLRWDFEERFLNPSAALLEPYRPQFSYSVIPAANHVLGDPGAVLAANRLTEAWLDAHLTRWIVQTDRGADAAAIHVPAVECSGLPEAVIARQANLEGGSGR